MEHKLKLTDFVPEKPECIDEDFKTLIDDDNIDEYQFEITVRFFLKSEDQSFDHAFGTRRLNAVKFDRFFEPMLVSLKTYKDDVLVRQKTVYSLTERLSRTDFDRLMSEVNRYIDENIGRITEELGI